MAAPVTEVKGAVISLVSNPYEFADRESGEVKRGTSHRLFLAVDRTSTPTEVTVRDQDVEMLKELASMEQFSEIHAVCSMFANAKNGRGVLSMRLDSFTPALEL